MSEQIEQEMDALNFRYANLGGLYGALSMIMWPGRWAITSAGGKPQVAVSGPSFAAALNGAKARLDELSSQQSAIAQTIGIEAAQ